MGKRRRVLVALVAFTAAVAPCAMPGCNASTQPSDEYCDVNAKLMDAALTCMEKIVASPGFCIRGGSEPTKSTQILCAQSPDGTTYVTDIPLNYTPFGDGWTFTRFGGPGNSPLQSMSPCAKLTVSLSPASGGGDAFSGSIPMCGATDAGGDGAD